MQFLLSCSCSICHEWIVLTASCHDTKTNDLRLSLLWALSASFRDTRTGHPVMNVSPITHRDLYSSIMWLVVLPLFMTRCVMLKFPDELTSDQILHDGVLILGRAQHSSIWIRKTYCSNRQSVSICTASALDKPWAWTNMMLLLCDMVMVTHTLCTCFCTMSVISMPMESRKSHTKPFVWLAGIAHRTVRNLML